MAEMPAGGGHACPCMRYRLSVRVLLRCEEEDMGADERRRVKRAEVSEETRRGRHRAAVNPNARVVGGTETGGGNAGEGRRRLRREQ